MMMMTVQAATYLYVRHSVVIEIAARCEALATNWTFCGINERRLTMRVLINLITFDTYREVSLRCGCVGEC
jgi:hypothetical protein